MTKTSNAYGEFLQRSNWKPAERFHQWNNRAMLEHFVQLSQLEPSETSILEVGAGTGRGGVASLDIGFRDYTGVEPVLQLADYCELSYGITIVRQSLPNLDLIKDSTFDALFAFHVIEHAPNYESAISWCSEMLRVLKPGGKLLLVAPDIRDCGSYFWDMDWSHGYPTTPQRVSQLLSGLGASITIATTFHLGSIKHSRKLLARLISILTPTRLIDSISTRAIGRPLASGFKIATIWGSTFVVGQKM